VAPSLDQTATDLHDVLFSQHFNATVHLARLLGSDDPENTAQEAFARLHVNRGRLRDASAALAYLRRTTTNLTTSRLRHLRVVRKTPGDVIRDHPSAEDSVVAAERIDRLLQAVRALPTRQRQVLILRYWMDLPLAEVADTLDMPVGTVKSTLSRAHSALAINLEDFA
jgi:RNA polymerase sigma factor (sigma-70 family)